MKTFLNVLYRRILYKIPLKFLLILLAIVAVFIASVKADNVDSLITYVKDTTTTTISSNGGIYQLLHFDNGTNDTYCIENISSSNTVIIGFNSSLTFNSDYSVRFSKDVKYICVSPYLVNVQNYLYLYNPFTSSTTITFKLFKLNALLGTNLTTMSSLECQTEYNLIPISSVDSNYCTTNNLCPSSECPVCPIGSGGVSSLYINDILHVGSPFIYMNIPQEIGWDYEYTQGGTNMLIDVEGYNVDYDKIENIVNTQSYTPDEYDLNSIITNVIPLFVPGLVIILFIYFVFKLIKKIF